MNCQEWADKLNLREITSLLSDEERKALNKEGFAVVYIDSDNIIADGSVRDKLEHLTAYETRCYLSKEGFNRTEKGFEISVVLRGYPKIEIETFDDVADFEIMEKGWLAGKGQVVKL